MSDDYTNYLKSSAYFMDSSFSTDVRVQPEKMPEVHKDEEAFHSGKGICYTDRYGKEYSRADLDNITRNPEVTESLFKNLKTAPPEEELKDRWTYRKCERCGTYTKEENLFKTRTPLSPCRNCRPVKAKGTFPVIKDPYEDKRNFYHTRNVTFHMGITTLFGCNGSGKTTLMKQIKEYLEKRGTPCFYFDNTGENGGNQLSHTMFSRFLSGMHKDTEEDDLSLAVFGMSASEGENVEMGLLVFLKHVMKNISVVKEYGEVYILIDALDSGLSYDKILTVKKALQSVLKKYQEVADVYIIISSNSWEMSEGTDCFSVSKMKYLNIRTYDRFCKEILASSKAKENRDLTFKQQKEEEAEEK